MSLLNSSGGSATALAGKQSAPANIGYDSVIVLAPTGTTIATETLALTESTWLDGVNSSVGSRWIVLPIAFDIEPSPEDDVYQTSSLGSKKFVREGLDTVVYLFDVTPVVMEQLRTLNGVDWSAFIFTSEGVIKCTSDDQTILSPFSIQNFRVEKPRKAGGDAGELLPVSITYGDSAEWASNPGFVEPMRSGVGGNWNPRDIVDPKAILGTVTSATTAGFTIALAGYDGVAFSGANLSNIMVRNSSTLAEITLDSLTETAVLGTYTALATIAAATYLIGCAPVGTASAIQGYAGLERDWETIVIS